MVKDVRMTDEPPALPPGWYPDSDAPDVVRWYDGIEWTERLAPAEYAGPPPSTESVAWVPGTDELGAEPADPATWVLPAGRSWQSIVAGYAGLLGLVVWPVAPIAVVLGVWALVRSRRGGKGRGWAVFAVVCGAIGTALGIWFVAARVLA